MGKGVIKQLLQVEAPPKQEGAGMISYPIWSMYGIYVYIYTYIYFITNERSPTVGKHAIADPICLWLHMGVSLNGGFPQSPPQVLIIFTRKTHGCWGKPTILGNPHM